MKRLSALFTIAAAGLSHAAGPPTPNGPKAPAAAVVLQQRQTLEAMRTSVETQRTSLRKQAGGNAAGSFFLLAPPSPMAPSGTGWREPDCEPLPDSKIDALVETAAKREDLQPELLRAVALQESGFRPCAASPKGAMGLMQLMPATAAQLGVKNPFDPAENVFAGARMLKDLLDYYGELPLALSAYNAGTGRVREAGGIPNIPETKEYVRAILSLTPFQ